jgi:hypothetical protein
LGEVIFTVAHFFRFEKLIQNLKGNVFSLLFS